MFGHDRFGPPEDYFATYQVAGGRNLDRDSVLQIVSSSYDALSQAYAAPERFDDFPTLAEALRQYVDLNMIGALYLGMRLSLVLLLLALTGCGSVKTNDTRLSIRSGATPEFVCAGKGKLVDFTMTGPRQREGERRDAFIVWELKPIGNTDNLDDLNTMGMIKYGVVPKGYIQISPENNLPPPLLVEGQSYMVQAMTVNAPWGQIAFQIRDGKAVEVPIK